MSGTGRRLPIEERRRLVAEAVSLHAAGATLVAIGRQLGVSHQTVAVWIRAAAKAASVVNAPAPQRVHGDVLDPVTGEYRGDVV